MSNQLSMTSTLSQPDYIIKCILIGDASMTIYKIYRLWEDINIRKIYK